MEVDNIEKVMDELIEYWGNKKLFLRQTPLMSQVGAAQFLQLSYVKQYFMARFLLLAGLFMLLTLQGCAVAGGIFKAGVWVGIFAVVLVVIVVGVIVSKSKK